MLGRFPANETDHINHVKDDNRWINLREATRVINLKNQAMYCNNTSGTTGVNWDKQHYKWVARIYTNEGRRIFLGRFQDIAAAITARKAAEIKYEYHQNHGKALPS